LYLDDTIYEERDKRPGISYMMWCKYVLDNFATVAEAVEGMKDVQIVSVKLSDESVFPAHIAIADPTGDSAIFEFIKGRLVVYHGREHTVMTNEPPYSVQMQNLKRYKGFGGVEEMLPGGIEPGDRFVRGAFYLKHLPAPKDGAQAVAYMWGIVRNISAPFGAPYRSGPATGTYPTWWGTVVDLTNGIFYFDMICSYNQNILRVDLKGLDFSAGTPVRVLDPKDPSLVGDVGQQFKPERKGE
jgi:choloylglycine hydrolase